MDVSTKLISDASVSVDYSDNKDNRNDRTVTFGDIMWSLISLIPERFIGIFHSNPNSQVINYTVQHPQANNSHEVRVTTKIRCKKIISSHQSYIKPCRVNVVETI